MGLLGDIGKVIIGGALGGPAGALIAFSVTQGDEVIEGTIDVTREIVKIAKDVYKAIPPEAFALGGMPLHGLLKHEFEDELILLGEIAGEAAIVSGLSWPALGPIGATLAIAEGAIPVYVTAIGPIIGKIHHRKLNAQEREMARYIFRDSLGDLEDIVLTNLGGIDGRQFVHPSTFGSVLVNLGNKYVHDATTLDGPVLFHELTHVWQARRAVFREVFFYRNIPDALDKDYNFEPPTPTDDRQWSSYGPEHQAGIVEAWTRGATRRSGSFDEGARRRLALGSPLFRYVNGNVRLSDDDAVTGTGRSVQQLLVDGGHATVRPMHSEPPSIWWQPGMFTPGVVGFGSVPVGETGTRTLTARNTSSVLVNVSIPASPQGSVFEWAAFDGVLAPDEEENFDLEFTPTSGALERAELDAVSTAVSSGARSRQSIPMVGKGTTGGLPV